MLNDVADDVYEAAFDPERWPRVIDKISLRSGAESGGMMVFDRIRPIKSLATGRSAELWAKVSEAGYWKADRRIPFFFANPLSGFVVADEYFSPDIAQDETAMVGRTLGLDQQVGTIIPMPTGELVVFILNRLREDGRFDPSVIGTLNRLHPHFARSAYLAARLGMERAHSAVSALQALGVPAAVLSGKGRVMANNALIQDVSETLVPLAFGGLGLARPAANKLLQEALAAAQGDPEAAARSIPVPAEAGRPAMIVHVVPLQRSASDIFSGATTLVAAVTVNASRLVPSLQVLMSLFDLTPAEMKLAAVLAQGLSLQEAALQSGIQMTTARTHLDRIFRKTGTSRQGQLVALLKGTQLL
ncbi:helix-turn-helix transcriptional regulator [Bosea vestrisii]|uniref:helix-turn-helix transcriptional regulator n=1 Tax=Bosea vestrisii TaxID=151416 RepID=UPI0024DF7F1E|nr:helix-turn-helix transcriptional regulator [Bosea vestrisii]WID96221.1 helix-turn-helix transcriptional regulator [Bosea vestrisii]